MCIVIDINCLSKVFNTDDIDHEEFIPVKEWIISGKGKIVYGGAKFKQELRKTTEYRRLLTIFKRFQKIVEIDDNKVDRRFSEIVELVDKNCDDPHLIAIFDISGCKLLCSHDDRSFPYIKDKQLYMYNKPPRIYKGKKQKLLLVDANIANCCKPAEKAPKEIKKILN